MQQFWSTVLPDLQLLLFKKLLEGVSGFGIFCFWAVLGKLAFGIVARHAEGEIDQFELSVLVEVEIGGGEGSVDQVVFFMEDVHTPHQLLQVVQAIHLADSFSTEAGLVQQFL